ncbi:hypothetical protein LEP1GSC021_4312 [Leptospira noguchii str. 1993005606]|uniref:Uncharacterized protein n=2 Tax=Leptospira noguchii TaxID=28182 RepID=M6YIA4_9LEPT|nr:hypothetical protein LEP1GSC035_1023 [Leptospira noguchii str. 2007001578]EMO29747.1 hypothetical protein LEP1GSC170_2840 [Leptospira interrogans serovar Bataviae str. HAI135]EMO91581.1 hypothetical protein LEP1GSC024_1989 [Leptospira noguchii str. 2001034031]EMS89407.1 hypothetical protein LEP1GSC073_0812 [Leptospira noguchii str. Cascata]EPE84090.1 hypothetical protein LEP1GSC021_4312 [Leptospira noguchii str. 1993005606]
MNPEKENWTALSAPVNQLYERNIMRYFIFSYNIERDP